MKSPNRKILTVLVVLLLVLAAVASPVVYGLVFWVARSVLLVFAASRAVQLAGGRVCDLLDFLTGVGGLLYVVGVLADLFNMPNVNGRDVDFLVRSIALAFLVLPLALAVLPRRLRVALGLCA